MRGPETGEKVVDPIYPQSKGEGDSVKICTPVPFFHPVGPDQRARERVCDLLTAKRFPRSHLPSNSLW